jgi:hypothetical protein
MGRRDMKLRPVGHEDDREIPLTQACRALRDHVKDGLHVGRRLADNLEDLAGGRLLLQGRGQLAIARLELAEQPHVLDGDHRLVGERLEQLHVRVGEGVPLPVGDADRADDLVLSEHRNDEEALKAARTLSRARQGVGVDVVLGLRVADPIHGPGADHTLNGDTRSLDRPRKRPPPRVELVGCEVVMTDEMDERPFDAIERRIHSPAQPDRVSRDRVEHRLHVGRRLADHAQNLGRRRLMLEGLGHVRVGLAKRPILLLQLGEQPHILDGDDGLVGKRFQ